MRLRWLCFGLVGFISYANKCTLAEKPCSNRITPAVQTIEKISGSIVPLFTVDDKDSVVGAGTAVFVDSKGYLLTAAHVLASQRAGILIDMKPHYANVVATLPERDVAILKVDLKEPIPGWLELGRSQTSKVGEPVVLGGNPSARGIVFSQGAINAISVEPSWPNILIRAMWLDRTKEYNIDRSRSTGGRIDFLQYDAMSNPGSSGGPLVNLDRQLIGLCSGNSSKENETYWAIPVDRIRTLLPHLLPADALGGFWTGLQVDLLAEDGSLQNVEENSPAWKAGLRSGDVLKSVDGESIIQAYEWHFRLMGKQAGDTLKLEIERDDAISTHEFVLAPLPSPALPDEDQLALGLRVRLFKGLYPILNLLEGIEPDYQGSTAKIDLEEIIQTSGAKSPFAMQLDGYLKVENKGLYRLSIESDDGSRLFLKHQLVIDNDLSHPTQELSRIVALEAGLTPIRIEYSDVGGSRGLLLKLKRFDAPRESDVPFELLRDSE